MVAVTFEPVGSVICIRYDRGNGPQVAFVDRDADANAFRAALDGLAPPAADATPAPAAPAPAPERPAAPPAPTTPTNGRTEFLGLLNARRWDFGGDRTETARRIIQSLVERLKHTHPGNFTDADWTDAANALRAHLDRPSHRALYGEPPARRPGYTEWMAWCAGRKVDPSKLGAICVAAEMAKLCGSTLVERDPQDWECADWRRLIVEMDCWAAAHPDGLMPGEDPFA